MLTFGSFDQYVEGLFVCGSKDSVFQVTFREYDFQKAGLFGMAYERKQWVGIFGKFENQKTQRHLFFTGLQKSFQIALEILKSWS